MPFEQMCSPHNVGYHDEDGHDDHDDDDGDDGDNDDMIK